MGIPNQLTMFRFLFTGLLIAAMAIPFPGRYWIALIIFIICMGTDYLDGYLARKLGAETAFGRLMDPLADKMVISAALIMLTGEGYIPGWITTVIVSREFLVTGLRLLAIEQNHVLSADRFGKLKTVLQAITVISLMILAALTGSGSAGDGSFRAILEAARMPVLLLTAAVTAASGISYFWKNRALLRKSLTAESPQP